MKTLELLRESKLDDLLPRQPTADHLEASGVVAHEGHFIIIFDNTGQVARIEASCAPANDNRWFSAHADVPGLEDMTYSVRQQRYYGLIEALPGPGGTYQAQVVEYDHHFVWQAQHSLPFAFDSDNKGFEGITTLQRGDAEYVLALCEGNHCCGGREGKQKGNGRIQIFQRITQGWQHVGTIKLPKAVRFTDYASLDIQGDTVAVLSQASSRLWLGTLDQSAWVFIDAGRIWHLPREEHGQATYCNAEGVSWLTADQLVVVSDKRKKGEPKRCTAKDQSVHIFRIP